MTVETIMQGLKISDSTIYGTHGKLAQSNGTLLTVLHKLIGWSSYEVVQRYAHLPPGYLSAYADNAKAVTNLLHLEKRRN